MIAYREPTRQELTVLRRSFDHWGIFDFVLDKEILVRENKLDGSNRRDIFLATRDITRTISQNETLSYIGMMIGHIRRKTFSPSMAGADLISRVSETFPFVVVNRPAEALVLYGRDIMYASVLDFRGTAQNNRTVIILNENRVAIGLGVTLTSIGNTTHVKDNRIVVKTIIDAGHYLREEG
jgi:60S ribosome subunit biogenesis protein NIP7